LLTHRVASGLDPTTTYENERAPVGIRIVDFFSRELRCVSDDINHGVARMDAFKWQAGAR
jgi:hypothetical protein